MLESKDKDTLLEMAKALGVKVNARLKKSDIIDKILDTTGSSSAPAAPVETAPIAPTEASSPATESVRRTPDSDGAPEIVLGPDGEPLADWEIELARKGASVDVDDTSATAEVAPRADRNRGDQPRGDRNRGDQQRGDQQRSDQPRGDQQRGDQQRGDQPRGDQPRGDQPAGGQQRDGQQRGDQPGAARNRNNDQAGNRNRMDGDTGDGKRRRRRRKGRGGHEGPQGEDVELIELDHGFESNEPFDVEGYLDIRDEGYGFLRVSGYLPSKADAYIPLKLARQYDLRKGDHITGKARPAGRNEKNPGLIEVYTVNGGNPENAKKRPHFESLTALFPDQRLTLEDPNDPTNMTARIIDLVSPIGKGQRGIIVSPPKAGKTTIMKTIAKSIELNNPDVHLMVLLIDERPEEVTDMRRSVKGEVISSTFDRPSDEHTHVAEMTIAKARRMVEEGKDVVIMLDGITRLSRAYNLAAPASGKILSGGIDAGALYPPKKFFGSARNVEEGGSLTILATALVDTNSRMDEAIFE
jgi:transcription termination factor Rho